MIKLLLINLAALLVYMSAWWLIGYKKRRLDTADTAWGGGFVLVALVSFINRQNLRSELIGLLVLIWGLRLARHIWQRSKSKGPDPRYQELSSKWKGNLWLRAYFSVFLTQGLLILVVSLPITAASSERAGLKIWLAVIGALTWLAGFITEAVADNQLKAFVSEPKNKGGVLDSGLWRYSRHPNYFGELMQWWAVAILALGPRVGLIGLAGPAVLSYLIIFISGIPSIESRRLKNPAYQAYIKHTSPLVPWFRH